MFGKIKHIHFVGIGGIGMSGIAEILVSLGYTVQGSDMAENANVVRLIDQGVKIVIDAKSFVYLSGTEVDFVENLSGSGFAFANPNAKRSCGCGSSFQA